MKTFLLVGIGGVYNYGCEAIVRGTELVLHEVWPDARILYASRRAQDDARRLAGARVEVIPRKPIARFSAVNVVRKALSSAGVRWVPADPRPALLDGVDAVLSIGGDIYTLGGDGSYPEALPKFGDAAERRGIPYVLWGASVGPFAANPSAERFFRHHLSKLSLVTAREQKSLEFLATFAPSTKAVLCADPAFAVAPELTMERNSTDQALTIGINLSPLALRYLGLGTVKVLRRRPG